LRAIFIVHPDYDSIVNLAELKNVPLPPAFFVYIPTFIVGLKQGEKLIDFVNKHDFTTLHVDYAQATPDQQRISVFLDIDLTSTSSLKFVDGFRKTMVELGWDHLVSVNLHFPVWSCPKHNCPHSCINDGDFCAVLPTGREPAPQTLLEHQTAMHCAFNDNHTRFYGLYYDYGWNCMNVWDNECLDNKLRLHGFEPSRIRECVNKDLPTYSKRDLDHKLRHRQLLYPGIMTPSSREIGNVNTLVHDLCLTFREENVIPPKECKGGLKPHAHHSVVWAYIVIPIILLSIIIAYAYIRRTTKRELAEDMDLQIRNALNQYYALTKEGAPTKEPAHGSAGVEGERKEQPKEAEEKKE
jgi:hypothetical protein